MNLVRQNINYPELGSLCPVVWFTPSLLQKYHEIVNNHKDLGPFPSRPHRAASQKGRISMHRETWLLNRPRHRGLILRFFFLPGRWLPPGAGCWVTKWCWAQSGQSISSQLYAIPQSGLRRQGRFFPAHRPSVLPCPADLLGPGLGWTGLQQAAACNQCGKGKHYQAERPGEGNWIYPLASSVWRESNMGRARLDKWGDIHQRSTVGVG